MAKIVHMLVDEAGEYHCEDGPAIIWDDSETAWFYHGRRHRTDGPAWTRNNCSPTWYINGKWIAGTNEYQARTGMSDEDMLAMILKYGNVE